MTPAELKAEILRLTREFSAATHAANRPGNDANRPAFIPGQTTVPYAGRVFTEDEVEAAVSATLDFWLTLGPEGDAFENELAALLGVIRHRTNIGRLLKGTESKIGRKNKSS